jgi:O-acetyl-ADP-ribose deacetylase (regulator of RNase III)
MKIEILKGDITQLKIKAIVNPANSKLIMGGGLAKIIKEKGGQEIEKEAKNFAPLPVGKAIITSARKLPADFIIHAPTMERGGQRISEKNVELAIKAVLESAEENGFEEIAVPGLGTGVGGVPPEKAAEIMIKTIKNFPTKKIKKIILVAFEEELYQAFKTKLR